MTKKELLAKIAELELRAKALVDHFRWARKDLKKVEKVLEELEILIR